MSQVTEDHARIWLQPRCCADPREGRQWCQDKVWPDGDCDLGAEPTEYVRADLASLTRKDGSEGVDELRPELEAAWTDFLDANPDGLTSPEDLPDHALVTCEQMVGIVANALAALKEGASREG